ncbi:inositol oxygenase 1-like [Musa acuminata AAA Group]|uniref:inositol oxygenase 1-like n=1 Tax=Musa acuminata AAA Group TaxID=214697 RepID=UPI0031D3E143
MTVIEPDPVLEENPIANNGNVEGSVEEEERLLDGGFVVVGSNAFGHSFRFYVTAVDACGNAKKKKKKEEYGKLQKAEMSIWDCIELLNEIVDESDPDLDEPQIEHLLQSAEAVRRDYPDQDWLHLTALIHDLGTVLMNPTFGGEPQWCVVMRSQSLGCALDESIVHHNYFKENPDYDNPLFQTRLGVYTENCGLDKVTMSWGHDEYMYLVMKGNETKLPPASFFIVRFHSLYALHRSGAYTYLMNQHDKEMLEWLLVFNKSDLYSKSKVKINLEEVKPYYLSLSDKYFPAKLRW